MPVRAEPLGSIDIDQQIIPIATRAGIGEGDLVIDVGAFIGDTAWALAYRLGAQVIAIEPFYDAFVCCVVNNQDLPVTSIHRAAGNGEFVKLIYDAPYCGNLPNLGMRSVREVPPDDPMGIQTLKIDDLGIMHPKLIKIDCEGSEIPVLLGASETIRRYKPVLFVEMFRGGLSWRGFNENQLESTIRDFGYNLEQIGPDERFDWYCTPI